jgi:hypothetical protein
MPKFGLENQLIDKIHVHSDYFVVLQHKNLWKTFSSSLLTYWNPVVKRAYSGNYPCWMTARISVRTITSV